jgi:ankyrin repeat protein
MTISKFNEAAKSEIDALCALLYKQAPLSKEDVTKVTELATALYSKDGQPPKADKIKITKGDYYTPLTFAVVRGHVNAITPLIAAGADPNARDKSGFTPLIMAAAFNNANAIDVLIASGANNLNAPDKSGYTPLTIAAVSGHVNAITPLIAAGADPNTKDGNNWTARDIAILRNRRNVLEYLDALENNTPESPKTDAPEPVTQ